MATLLDAPLGGGQAPTLHGDALDVPLAPAPVLSGRSLTGMGVGGIIGTGIFVMTGMAAKSVAGPAVIVSFLIAALACGCAALCLCDLAARYPRTGGAYVYSRALVPAFPAWLVGWNMLLQYGLAAASVAQGWSHYFGDTLRALSLPTVPAPIGGASGWAGGITLDLPALAIIGLASLVIVRGIRLSIGINHAVVALKLALIGLIVAVGAFYFRAENWVPFAPFGWGVRGGTGGPPQGVLAGASLVFYAFLGFEAVALYSEEARAPTRSVPRGIIGSLAVCTLLYIAVAGVLCGMVPYAQLSPDAPISEAFGQVGLGWVRLVVAFGAMLGITSVLLIILMSLPRIVQALGRDGYLPASLGSLHPRFGTPARAMLVAGALIAVPATLIPLRALGETAILANLVTFLVLAGLSLLARKRGPVPDGAFSLPLGSFVPLATILICGLLIAGLPPLAFGAFAAWTLAGGVVYALFHRRRGA